MATRGCITSWPRLKESEQAQLRSQSGPLAGMTFSVAPSNVFTRIESPLFRVLLQRRLRLPLPLSARQCRCGRPLDILGHHRARAPLFGGAQLAVDTTLVSALHCDGSAHPRAAHVDGAVLVAARRRRERTNPELANPRRRSVGGLGWGGWRRSEETTQFLTLLARAKARCEPIILRKRAEYETH